MEFQIFKDGKVFDDFKLCGAYLFGTDGIAIRRAEIVFNGGTIHAAKPNLETAGLALLWPVEGFGKMLLPTTCLPERRQPYNLNLEIVRAKLMQIINKREDWSFFNEIEGFEDVFKEARSLLIQAIQNLSDPPLASRFADAALKRAVFFSEKLAIKQAESLFRTRGRSRGFGRRCLGCRVNPARVGDPRYLERIMEMFGFVTVPVSWALMEPQKGTYDFSVIDACITAFAKKRLAICIGPLLCFSREHLPKWLLTAKPGFEKIRDIAYKFVLKVVSRYAGSVHAWRVISGLNALNHFGFSFEQILEMTRAANMAAKAASGRSVKIVEVGNPWGEYYADIPTAIPPLVYMDMVVQSGLNFDAFGLQLRFGKNQAGMHVRDFLQISAVLDYFGTVAKPLYITEVEVPSEQGPGLQDAEQAGIWHEQWSQNLQGQWIEQFYKIALSKPFVDTVTYGSLTDSDNGELAAGGLLTSSLEPKTAFLALKKMYEAVSTR